jgi:hypothetical protein
LDEAQFRSLTIAKQCGFLFLYSNQAHQPLCRTRTTAAAFLLYLLPFDVSRLGVIGRSMFIISFLSDQTGRYDSQSPA